VIAGGGRAGVWREQEFCGTIPARGRRVEYFGERVPACDRI